MEFLTIGTPAYGGRVTVLAESIARHHPATHLTWYVVGTLPRTCPDLPSNVRIANVEGFATDLKRRAMMLTAVELCTSVKAECLIEATRQASSVVVYLDPDTLVLRSLHTPLAGLELASLGLTPHWVHPDEAVALRESDICRIGAYNLGFCAIGKSPSAGPLLEWWKRRTLYDCVRAQERGVFVDQRWMDLVPGLFPDVHVLRDPGLNVAWWNGQARDWNGAAIVHFSGFDSHEPSRATRHFRSLDVSAFGVEAGRIFTLYHAALAAASNDQWESIPNEYDRTPGGLLIPEVIRAIFRDWSNTSSDETDIEMTFLNWLNTSPTAAAPPRILTEIRSRLGPWCEKSAIRDQTPLVVLASDLLVDPSLVTFVEMLDPALLDVRFGDILEGGFLGDRYTRPLPISERCGCGLPKPGRFS